MGSDLLENQGKPPILAAPGSAELKGSDAFFNALLDLRWPRKSEAEAVRIHVGTLLEQAGSLLCSICYQRSNAYEKCPLSKHLATGKIGRP